MNNHKMIQRLKGVGIQFEVGLTDQEFQMIESSFGFRFPVEIKGFLSCGLPISKDFFNWRDLSPANIEKFHSFHESMKQPFTYSLPTVILWYT